jgi:hypothetical protein
VDVKRAKDALENDPFLQSQPKWRKSTPIAGRASI